VRHVRLYVCSVCMLQAVVRAANSVLIDRRCRAISEARQEGRRRTFFTEIRFHHGPAATIQRKTKSC